MAIFRFRRGHDAMRAAISVHGACVCSLTSTDSGSGHGLDPPRAATLGKGMCPAPLRSFVVIHVSSRSKANAAFRFDIPHMVGLPGWTAGPVWHQVRDNQGGTGKMIGRCSHRAVWPSKHRNSVGRWWFPAKANPEIRCTEDVDITTGKSTSHGGQSSAPASARAQASSHEWPVVPRWRTRC